MRKLFVTTIATVAIVALAQAQQQTQVQVDGKNYTITEYPQGRFAPTHMVSLSGPDGTAMVTVDKASKITAVINPPGGQLNGVDYRPIINQVWTAYQAQKNADAANTPASQPTPANDANDPNAALRAQANAAAAAAMARAGVVTGQQSGQPAKLTVEFPPAGGAVVHGTPYGDIVFNDNATEAHFTRESTNALAGKTTQEWEYDYVGDKGKPGAIAKGVGGALAGAFNVRHAGRVDYGGIEVYTETNGEKPMQVYGTRQKTFAVNPYTSKPLDNGIRQLAMGFLDAAKEALGVATKAATDQKVESFRPEDAVVKEFTDWKHKL